MCCRDGYARQCLVRPLYVERPAAPTKDMIAREVTGLCSGCRQRRIASGAKDLDNFR